MAFDQLNADCVHAILRNLPVTDLLKLRLVCRSINRSVDDAWGDSERKPLALQIEPNCPHTGRESPVLTGAYRFPPNGSSIPRIDLGGVAVRSLPNLASCQLLPHVKKVHIRGGFSSQIPDFEDQYCNVLSRLPAAEYLKISSRPIRMEECLGFPQLDTNEHMLFAAVRARCPSWLSHLTKLKTPFNEPFSDTIKADFHEGLAAMHCLKSLTVYGALLPGAETAAANTLSNLRSLHLITGFSEETLPCQKLLELVCEHCSNLKKLNFWCSKKKKHLCVDNFNVMRSVALSKLSLALEVSNPYPVEMGAELRSVQHLSVYLEHEWGGELRYLLMFTSSRAHWSH